MWYFNGNTWELMWGKFNIESRSYQLVYVHRHYNSKSYVFTDHMDIQLMEYNKNRHRIIIMDERKNQGLKANHFYTSRFIEL